MIPIKMSSLYLSEVQSINLVKWIQRAKILQTDMRLRTRDQMASQIAGGKKNTEPSLDIKRRRRGGQVFIALSKDEKMTVGGGCGCERVSAEQEAFAGVRRHGERRSEGKQSVKMTGYGSCCHRL